MANEQGATKYQQGHTPGMNTSKTNYNKPNFKPYTITKADSIGSG